MLEYILIVVLLVDIVLDVYSVKKIDKFKEEIKKDDIPEIYNEIVGIKDRVKTLEFNNTNTIFKDVKINPKSNYYITLSEDRSPTLNKLNVNEFNKLRNYLNENDPTDTVNSSIDFSDDNNICIVTALDPIDSKLDNIRIYDTRDFDNISLIYTIKDMNIPIP